MKKGRNYNGILSKGRVPNYIELLKRAKVVFDTGNAQEKALALRLLGCWADLGKDSVQIRYMILLSLQSPDVSQVKAALFAAGCFCRLSEDFACIVLEILIGIMSSSETASGMKLSIVRVFARMRCSSSTLNRAYKAGKELMLCLGEDELKAEMLSSLSKLAIESSILIPQQVDFLLTFVIHESSSLVKDRALKYLYFMFGGGACCFAIQRNVLATLISILEDKELLPNFCCDVLQILHKIICSIHPDLHCIDVPDLFSLVLLVKNATQSSSTAGRCLALSLLVDILCIFKREITEHSSSFPEKLDPMFSEFHESSDDHRDGPTRLICDAILLIVDEMNSLVKQMIFVSGVVLSEAKQEFRRLLNLILQLLVEYHSLALVILDRLKCLIQTLVSACGTFSYVYGEHSQEEIGAYKCESVLNRHGPDNKKEKSIFFELILCVCRLTITCLNRLDETGSVSSEVCHRVKSLVEGIRQNGSCCCDAYEIFFLDIYLDIMFNNSRKAENRDSEESKVSHIVYWAAQERCALDFTKMMLRKRNYWEAYRVGMYACAEGAWFAAAFTFRKLMDGLQSVSCHFWVRSLMLLAGAESEIKLIIFPNAGIEMINRMQNENDYGKTFSSVEQENKCGGGYGDLNGCQGKFAKINSRICSSEEILASSGATDGVYYFQRWFLSLRSKVLEIVIDMLELLDSLPFKEEQLNKDLEGNANIHFTPILQNMPALATGFARLSLRLINVAKEYDFLAVSFLDIDSKSYRNISRQALSCAVLAFCTCFALYFSNSSAYKTSLSGSLGPLGSVVEISQNTVLKDLIERVWNLDEKVATELQKLKTVCTEVVNNMHSRTETNNCALIDRAVLLVYKCFIEDILCIQEDSWGIKDEEGLHGLLLQGIHLLSGIIRRWIGIPCSIPKYFFRVRPCVGAELFIFNSDSTNPNGLSIKPGFQLSLNLCIQVKNISRVPHVGVLKIYCVLAIRSSDRLTSCGDKIEQTQWQFQARETDEMVELFDILLHHIRIDNMKVSRKHCDVDGGGPVTSCVCFELNQTGQGFSTCLLDASSLPEGSYPIKWHCCCIDRNGHHWSLLPLNLGSICTIKK